MATKIRLTIQEIVSDFEGMVRCHERLDACLDRQGATDEDISGFHSRMIALAVKYIPNYRKHLPKSDSAFDEALEIYGMLLENFREIFFQLV